MTDDSPGGYLDPSETDQEGLLTRLDECLGIPNGEGGYIKPAHDDWQVAECLSIWWRPNLDTFAVSCLSTLSHEKGPDESLIAVPLPPSSRLLPQGLQETLSCHPAQEQSISCSVLILELTK